MQPSPVFKIADEYFFYDEAWADYYGPYPTEKVAHQMCTYYAEYLHTGEMNENFAEEIHLSDADLAKLRKTAVACWKDCNALRKELTAISMSLRDHRYMDPPDGGDVSLAEQVARMRKECDELRAVLQEAITWDGEDDCGVPAVWLERAISLLEGNTQ